MCELVCAMNWRNRTKPEMYIKVPPSLAVGGLLKIELMLGLNLLDQHCKCKGVQKHEIGLDKE